MTKEQLEKKVLRVLNKRILQLKVLVVSRAGTIGEAYWVTALDEAVHIKNEIKRMLEAE